MLNGMDIEREMMARAEERARNLWTSEGCESELRCFVIAQESVQNVEK